MFQNQIREHYDELTPGFRRLADFIINNTLESGFLTAGELARRVQVDPATVVRFAQEIGYSGYRDLSREIKKFVQDQISIIHRAPEGEDIEETIVHTLRQNLEKHLQFFFNTEVPTLTQAIQALNRARHVWIAGEYISHDIAQMLAKQFQIIGIAATALHPSMMASATMLASMQAGDALLALAITYAGIDTGYVVKMARARGVKTICLTGYGTSLPAREAEIALIAPIKNDTGPVSYEMLFALTGIIWSALATLNIDKTATAFTQVFDTMSELRQLRAETPGHDISQ